MKAALLVLLALTACMLPGPNQMPKILRDATLSIVQVDAFTPSGWNPEVMQHGYGSGVVVACRPAKDGYAVRVLTAGHCVTAPKEGGFLRIQGVEPKLVALNEASDVAMLEVLLPTARRPLPIRTLPLEVGQDVWTLGFSGGCNELWISRGIVSAMDRGGDAAPGDSGGAVIDAQGRLVGTITKIDVTGGGMLLIFHHCTFTPTCLVLEWLAHAL